MITYEPDSTFLLPLRQHRFTPSQEEDICFLEQSFQTPPRREVRVISPSKLDEGFDEELDVVRKRLFDIEEDDPIREELFVEEHPETEISSLKIALMLTGAAAIYCVVMHPFLKKRFKNLLKGVGEKSSPPL